MASLTSLAAGVGAACWLERLSSFPCGFSFPIRLAWPLTSEPQGNAPNKQQLPCMLDLNFRALMSHLLHFMCQPKSQGLPRSKEAKKWAPHLSRRSSKVTWQIHTRMGGLCGHRTNNHAAIVRIIELAPCQHLSQSDLCFRTINLVDCTY